MARPWYAHYPADYHRKAAGLSMLEHGAYRLLLDHYYSTGKPLPAIAEQLHRICMAVAPDEQAAIAAVVARFFVKKGDVLRNNRADEEIAKAEKLSKTRAKVAKTRYAIAPAIAGDLQPVCSDFAAPQSQSQLHKQKKDISSLRSDIATPKKSRRQLPEGFPEIKDEDWAKNYWLRHGRSDLCSLMGEEIEKFRDHHAGKLTSSADWSGSWRTWARNAIKFNNGSHNGKQRKSPHDTFLSAAAGLIGDELTSSDTRGQGQDNSRALKIGGPLLSA